MTDAPTTQTGLTAMLTDLYELTMAEVYIRRGMLQPATFSLFIRDYPAHRGYLVSAGLEPALAFLEGMRFAPADLAYLDSTGLFSPALLDYLAAFRFDGHVAALPEGRLFFRNEPLLEVTAPLPAAQIVETGLINACNLHVTLATKVSRCVQAARGRPVVDFALRRTHGADAGLALARTGFLAGLNATSNVLAGQRFGIPVSGTMAHSYVTSFEEEIEAFRAFAEVFGDRTVLLVDTYDTLAGARNAAVVAREMAARGQRLRGVRLDSGDMVELSRRVRELFGRDGLDDVEIFASGGFDEYEIDRSLRREAAIDAFGVGTRMGVAADSPYTDMAYKLVQLDGRPVMKLSAGKETLVAPKQVWRRSRDGRLGGDTIGLREEALEGEPLLRTVMRDGRRTDPPESLQTLRQRLQEELAQLDAAHRRLTDPDTYPVAVSPRLQALQRAVRRRLEAGAPQGR